MQIMLGDSAMIIMTTPPSVGRICHAGRKCWQSDIFWPDSLPRILFRTPLQILRRRLHRLCLNNVTAVILVKSTKCHSWYLMLCTHRWQRGPAEPNGNSREEPQCRQRCCTAHSVPQCPSASSLLSTAREGTRLLSLRADDRPCRYTEISAARQKTKKN